MAVAAEHHSTAAVADARANVDAAIAHTDSLYAPRTEQASATPNLQKRALPAAVACAPKRRAGVYTLEAPCLLCQFCILAWMLS